MKFSDELQNYIDLLNCTPKDICEKSQLSPTLISRYLNKKRTPRVQSEYFDKIVNSIYEIAQEKNINLDRGSIFQTLSTSIKNDTINYDDFVTNFNTLLLELKINISDFSKTLGYDVSFISKIKNKTRKPADLENFIHQIGDYIVDNYKSEEKKHLVMGLIKCHPSTFNDNVILKDSITKWITSQNSTNTAVVQNFLTKLDNFNLNDYINADFSKIKIPTAPIILRNSKTYYGAERKKAIGE